MLVIQKINQGSYEPTAFVEAQLCDTCFSSLDDMDHELIYREGRQELKFCSPQCLFEGCECLKSMMLMDFKKVTKEQYYSHG